MERLVLGVIVAGNIAAAIVLAVDPHSVPAPSPEQIHVVSPAPAPGQPQVPSDLLPDFANETPPLPSGTVEGLGIGGMGMLA
jgi:hypothetical protein